MANSLPCTRKHLYFLLDLRGGARGTKASWSWLEDPGRQQGTVGARASKKCRQSDRYINSFASEPVVLASANANRGQGRGSDRYINSFASEPGPGPLLTQIETKASLR